MMRGDRMLDRRVAAAGSLVMMSLLLHSSSLRMKLEIYDADESIETYADDSIETFPNGTFGQVLLSSSSLLLQPLDTRREEDRVVYAGVAPPGWDPDIPRQSATSAEPLIDPPVAIPDPYGWLRDENRNNTEVLDHLRAENAYTEGMTEHLGGLRGKLYEEMSSAFRETDYSTPRPHGEYYYYTRTYVGKMYHCRAPKSANPDPFPIRWDQQADTPILNEEEVTLDIGQLAEGKAYFNTGSVAVSPSHELLAYTVDSTGNELYQLFIKNLSTGELLPQGDEELLEISASIVWGADDTTLFYMKKDEAKRQYQVYQRRLNADGGGVHVADEMIFEQLDDTFWSMVYTSLDGEYLFVYTGSSETSEVFFRELDDHNAELRSVAVRRSEVLYSVRHRDGQWWIGSNVGGLPNIALWVAPAVADSQDLWNLVVDDNTGLPLFDGSETRVLGGISCFQNHVVASGREGGLPRIWVVGLDGTNGSDVVVSRFEQLSFEQDSYDAFVFSNYEFETDELAVGYDSLVTPLQYLQINMDDTSDRLVLKEWAVPGYNKDLYGSERVLVPSRDGTTQIPVSLVYRRDVMQENLDAGEPLTTHLYGYGSYGETIRDSFSSERLPLLNRGVVYVIAHVRGGGEMGRQWYECRTGAKKLCKKNTFNDFVDVARWLIQDRRLTTAERLSCEGRSAGGLLVGATINRAPELFKVALLGVPFVDVVVSMVDASLPLTAGEWEEWGNPNEIKYHDYMMEYSPMQNTRNVKYPACLLTGGLYDPRVQFWEPAKFAAQLRYAQAPESGPVCLKMDMSAGHFSASGKYLREKAFEYAFVLDQLGLADRQ